MNKSQMAIVIGKIVEWGNAIPASMFLISGIIAGIVLGSGCFLLTLIAMGAFT